MSPGQGEGAAAGGLGEDAIPSAVKDLVEEILAGLEADSEDKVCHRCTGDDEDDDDDAGFFDSSEEKDCHRCAGDDEDDDDDAGFFDSSEEVERSSHTRMGEGFTVVIKEELEETKVGVAYDARDFCVRAVSNAPCFGE